MITAVLGLLVWSAIPAAPARATSTIFIDDSRDGVQCPGARDLVDLSTLDPFPIENGETITGAQQITIANNTLYDFNESGTRVESLQARYQPTITGNVIWIELFTGGSVTVADNDITGNKVIKYDQRTAGTGVRIFSFDPEESIRNNTVSGNTVLGFGSDEGVTTFDTNPAHFKVKSNEVGFATPGN